MTRRGTDGHGIRQTPTGYQARVQVSPLPRVAKRFPLATPLDAMQRWRAQTRRELLEKIGAHASAEERRAAVRIVEVILPLRCGTCSGTMRVLYAPRPGAEPHTYGIDCLWCGRTASRRLPGVLLRVTRGAD